MAPGHLKRRPIMVRHVMLQFLHITKLIIELLILLTRGVRLVSNADFFVTLLKAKSYFLFIVIMQNYCN